MSIEQNIKILKKQIIEIAENAGRNPDDIQIIAASKYANAEQIMEAARAGIRTFGENKAQDFVKKRALVKVKYIVGNIDLIQSVDSLRLALEINSRAEKLKVVQDILIEANISGEKSKFGERPERLFNLIKDIALLSNLKIKGLMVMAPLTDDYNLIKNIFCLANKYFHEIQNENIFDANFQILSMGMTNDFKAAIEEGSNMVRIGSAIFKSN